MDQSTIRRKRMAGAFSANPAFLCAAKEDGCCDMMFPFLATSAQPLTVTWTRCTCPSGGTVSLLWSIQAPNRIILMTRCETILQVGKPTTALTFPKLIGRNGSVLFFGRTPTLGRTWSAQKTE